MKWYKTSRQSAWKTKTYPEKAVNRSLWNFYNWLKAKNVIVTFYHGTSDLAYSLMGKTGWMTPPTWRGREKEEGRYSTDIHDEAEKGLDKLFFTKRFEQANHYAERDAKTWNSNTERVLETKKSLNIDPKIIANPLVIKIALPLHDLDEVKGNIFGTYIYNESGMDDEIRDIIKRDYDNDVKLKEILEVISNSYVNSSEFTVKGGLPVSRKEGFAHVSLLGADDYAELLMLNYNNYDAIPKEIKEKYPDKIEEAYVAAFEKKLVKYPYSYLDLPSWMPGKYPERIYGAFLSGIEAKMESDPDSYETIPDSVMKKYPERVEALEKRYISYFEKKLALHPERYVDIRDWMRKKYPDIVAGFESKYVDWVENKIKEDPSSYQYLDYSLLEKYSDRFLAAYIVGLENAISKDYKYRGNVPQWVSDEYGERIEAAYLSSIENALKKSPKEYGNLPLKTVEKYSDRLSQFELPYVEWLEENLPTHANLYLVIPINIRDKYADRLSRFEEGVVVYWENRISKSASDLAIVPKLILEKYGERLQIAALQSWMMSVKVQPNLYKLLPIWIRNEHPEEYEKLEEIYVDSLLSMDRDVVADDEIPDWVRQKYPEKLSRIEEKYIKWYEGYLERTPSGYNLQSKWSWIKEKYPERAAVAYVSGLKRAVIRSPNEFGYYWSRIPQRIKDAYPDKMIEIREIYVSWLLEALRNFPHYISAVPTWVKDDYLEKVEEAYLDGFEKLISNSPFDFPGHLEGVPQLIKERNVERINKMEESYITYLESALNKDISTYQQIPLWIMEKYPERIGKFESQYIEWIKANNPHYIPPWVGKKYPEFAMAHFNGWYKLAKLFEISSFQYNTLDQEKQDFVFDKFKDSYEKSVGTSWDKGKFVSRANDWTFFGDQNGYITVRVQRSGLWKLTGVAGSPKSILKGFDEMMEEGKTVPIWGIVTEDIANLLGKKGFKVIKGIQYAIPLKMLLSKIPKGVLGGADIKVNWDSSLEVTYGDVGTLKKFLVGNQNYFNWLKSQLGSYLANIPGVGILFS